MMSDSKIRMVDVFDLPVTAEQHNKCNGWWTVDTANGEPVDESGDGGFYQETAEAIVHAINNHDHLTAENEALQAEVERLREYKAAYDEWIVKTQWVQDTLQPLELGLHRADALRDRIQKLEQERDKLKERLAHCQRFLASGILYTYDELLMRDADVIERFLTTEAPRIDAGGPNPIDPQLHHCEWTLHQERERLHAAANKLRHQNTEEN